MGILNNLGDRCTELVRGAVTLALIAGISAASASIAETCQSCTTTHPGTDPDLLPRPERPVQIGVKASPLTGGAQSVTLQGGTQSTTLQGGSQSASLQGGTQSTTLQASTQSTTLQGSTESAMLQVGTKSTLIQGGVEREAQLNILILMDSSHSMDEALDGTVSDKVDKKISLARHVLEETLQVIPSDINVGLRVFGQSFKNDPYNDCQQSVLTVPIAPHNRRTIIESVKQLRPFGLTPLAYTLMNAERDFRGLPGVHHVVLISDGIETCGGDPCTYIRRLTAMGIKMKVDIVGFGLKHDQVAKAHLNCIAQASGGKYYEADTAGQLRDSIKQSINQAMGDAKVCGKVITRMKEPILDPTKIPAGFR